MKKPAADLPARAYDIGDDEDVPLICPTRQAQKNWFGASTFKWKYWAQGTSQRSIRSQGGR